MGRGTEMILAKEFEGELWIKAADYQRQKKEWVGLTDQDRFELINEWNIGNAAIGNLCALIEAKLKEKNAT